MEGVFFRTIGNAKVSEGAHRLILSILLAVTTMPKTAVSTFPLLAALGHVTDKLQTICGWDASLLTRIRDTYKLKNQRINDPCLFQMFFDALDPTGHPGTTLTPTPTVGRYYKLMLTEFSQAKLNETFWRANTDRDDVQMAAKLFNKFDSDVAVIASELLDLASSDLAIAARSSFNVESMSEPGSHFSGLDAIRDLEPLMNRSQAANEAYLDASADEGTQSWSHGALEFFEGAEKSPLFRVDGECCLYFNVEEGAFCNNPAVNNSARCVKHQDTANSKFMRILSQLNNKDNQTGFSLSRAVFRFFNEPQIVSDYVEYSPCLEGALPAFKHSTGNLKGVLDAGYKSFKAGYLTKSTIGFKDNFFREAFPNATDVSTQEWMHAYLSIRVSVS